MGKATLNGPLQSTNVTRRGAKLPFFVQSDGAITFKTDARWRYLLGSDPAQSQLVQATASLVGMPSHRQIPLRQSANLKGTRRCGDELAGGFPYG